MPAARQAATTVGKCSASVGRKRTAIEKGAAAGGDLPVDRARHHVAGAELGIVVDGAHEPFAAGIDQERAFAAQRLGGERRRVAADIDGGRMKLHEFGVGDHRAGAGGDGDAFAARLARIGGDGVDLAGAAGRQHYGAGGKDEPTAAGCQA